MGDGIEFRCVPHSARGDASRLVRFRCTAVVDGAALYVGKGSIATIRFAWPRPLERLFMLAGVADT